MSYFTTTFQFDSATELDNALIYSKAASQPVGSYMERVRKLTLEEAVYSKLKDHPTLSHVKQNAGNHMIMSGSIKQIYTWDASEGITQSELDQFWSLLSSKAYGVTVTLVESSATNRRFEFTASFENDSSFWVDYPLPYVLDATTSRMEVTEAGTDLVCCVFPDNDPDSWAKEHCNIADGESFTLNKEGDDYCYVIFGEAVTKGSDTLQALKPYRLTSSSISVTNNSGNSCKVFRVYK